MKQQFTFHNPGTGI